jgi:hypothetical protein
VDTVSSAEDTDCLAVAVHARDAVCDKVTLPAECVLRSELAAIPEYFWSSHPFVPGASASAEDTETLAAAPHARAAVSREVALSAECVLRGELAAITECA